MKLTPPLLQDFILEKTDAAFNNTGEPTMVTIRQASNGDVLERDRLFGLVSREYGPDSVRYTNNITDGDIRQKEAYLTLAACNIEGADGKPLFLFKNGRIAMQEREFDRAWGELPPIIADEISSFVTTVNAQWGPVGNA